MTLEELDYNVVSLLNRNAAADAFSLFMDESSVFLTGQPLDEKMVCEFWSTAIKLLLYERKYGVNLEIYRIKEYMRQVFFNSMLELNIKILGLALFKTDPTDYFGEDKREYDLMLYDIDRSIYFEGQPDEITELHIDLEDKLEQARLKKGDFYDWLLGAYLLMKDVSQKALESNMRDYVKLLELSRLNIVIDRRISGIGGRVYQDDYTCEWPKILRTNSCLLYLQALAVNHPLLVKPIMDYLSFLYNIPLVSDNL